ncbi:TonB-dependent receptor, partial [Vibrio alfacsensis]
MANQTGKKVVSLSLLALSIGQAFATEEVNESQPTNKQKTDENMVVTATRYSQDTDKIPGSVHVISTKELEQQTAVSDDLT